MSRRSPKNRAPDDGARRGRGAAGAIDRRRDAQQSSSPRNLLLAAALVVAVFLVYQPAWQAGFIWDDDAHVTKRALRSWDGLGRIWTEVGATLQYYPLLHSFFWLEHRLWGDAPLGYHLTNLALHALAALLALLLLRDLKLPGAWLAAAIFALHPVQVESVAWITEQKNTLSAVFYLAAALVYLRFDRTRRLAWYLAAAALFVLAVLTKTITATLPGALLVIFWWQRGRLSWKSDVLPLAPFFLLGAGGGMVTAWWELELNKCFGPEFEFSFPQRLLIAGRAAWFLCGKLLWPTHLTFIYPRWAVDVGAWWQWLFPLGAAALLAGLWAVRRWSRAPLAAALYFGGTLFPMLGFFNLYTFRYSLVANHYQYLASLGIIALVSAGMALALDRWRVWDRPAGYAVCLGLLAILAGLTWRQSRMYADAETLYRTTIAENPECWLAEVNLGIVLSNRGQLDAAIEHYGRALDLKPDCAEAYCCLGLALVGKGQYKAAVAACQKALDIDPELVEAHNNLGLARAHRGEFAAAMRSYRRALELKRDFLPAHVNLARVLTECGRADEAVEHYEAALAIDPGAAEVHLFLGLLEASRDRFEEAIDRYQEALRLRPAFAEVHFNLANLLARHGRLDEAIAHYQKALDIQPDHDAARRHLAAVQAARGGAPKP